MELTIKNKSSRLLLERTDNGVILFDVNSENEVTSKVGYEIYFKDGIIDFETMGFMILELMECLSIPTIEPETNRKLTLAVTKIDPDKPVPGEEGEEGEDE